MFWKAKKAPADKPPHVPEGAYRLHRREGIGRFTALAKQAFPDFSHRISCFGSDWLGRQFASDTGRIVDGEPQVLMLEPGTGEALEIPASVAQFHDVELKDHADAAIALKFYENWLASGGRAPRYDECVGYRVPLFLGGADDLTNLEMSDLEVYWHLSAQLIIQTRGLSTGTRIRIKPPI